MSSLVGVLDGTLHTKSTNPDLRFPWKLKVLGIRLACDDVRWEQFIKGSFVLYFTDTTRAWIYARSTISNPKARTFGPWVEDLLKHHQPGPRPVTPRQYTYNSCRAKSAALGGTTYEFEDAPGYSKRFMLDDFRWQGRNRKVYKVAWNVEFEHKLWASGQAKPFYVARIALKGEYGHTVRGNQILVTKFDGRNLGFVSQHQDLAFMKSTPRQYGLRCNM